MRLTDEQIGAELRALRETPSEEFAATLDSRAAAGFPAAKAEAHDRTLTWGRLGMVLAPITAVAIVAVVVTSLDNGGGPISSGGGADSLSSPASREGAVGKATPSQGSLRPSKSPDRPVLTSRIPRKRSHPPAPVRETAGRRSRSSPHRLASPPTPTSSRTRLMAWFR